MRAAVLSQYGTPAPGEWPEPEPQPGATVVDVTLAGLNPVDVSKAAGSFYGGSPTPPFVAGSEGVGTAGGRRVYFDRTVAPYGSIAQRTLVPDDALVDVPAGLADAEAVAIGVAGLAGWLSVVWRARVRAGDHVLVLGASGSVGGVAVQAARIAGAARVVAAGRSAAGLERARSAGADAAVEIHDEASAEQLAERFRAAAGGRIDVVIDPLWGTPLEAAVLAAGKHARIVVLGQSAGPEATLRSADVRGKVLDILGYSNFAVPPAERRAAYAEMAAHAAGGRLRLSTETLPLDRVGEAFERQLASPGVKLLIEP